MTSPVGSVPSPDEVNRFHQMSDKDVRPESQHHTLGNDPNQAASGNHSHNGQDSAILTNYVSKYNRPTITGSRGGNVALANLLFELHNAGVINDQTVS